MTSIYNNLVGAMISADDNHCAHRNVNVTTHVSLKSDILNYFADREIEESECGNITSSSGSSILFKISDVIAKFPLQTVAKLEKLYDELKSENKIVLCTSNDSLISSSSSSSNSRSRLNSYRLNLDDDEVASVVASRRAHRIKRKVDEENEELEKRAKLEKIKLDKKTSIRTSEEREREKENKPSTLNKNTSSANSDDGDNFFGFNSVVTMNDEDINNIGGNIMAQSSMGTVQIPNQEADFSSWCPKTVEFKSSNKIYLDIVKDVLTAAWASGEDPIKMSDCKARCANKGLAEEVFEENVKHLSECNHIFLDEGDIYQV